MRKSIKKRRSKTEVLAERKRAIYSRVRRIEYYAKKLFLHRKAIKKIEDKIYTSGWL